MTQNSVALGRYQFFLADHKHVSVHTRPRDDHRTSMCSSNVWWSASCRRIKTKINADLMAFLWSSSHILQRNLVFRADLAIIFCRKSLCGENNVSIQHLVFCLWFVLLFQTWCCCTINASSNTFLPRNGVLRKETFRHWKISSPSVCKFNVLQNNKSSDTVASLMLRIKTESWGRPAISLDSSN